MIQLIVVILCLHLIITLTTEQSSSGPSQSTPVSSLSSWWKCHKKFLSLKRQDKLECLPWEIIHSLIWYLLIKPWKYLIGAPLRQAPASLAINRLGWKGLPKTNTPAYFATSSMMKKLKYCSIVSINPWSKCFSSPLTLWTNKLECLSLKSLSGLVNICEWGVSPNLNLKY